MIPTDEYVALRKAAMVKGQSGIQGAVIIDASGELANATFHAALPEKDLKQLSRLISNQKYMAAIGLDGNAVASKLDVEVYLDGSKP